MKYEQLLIELFVNQILRSKQIITFISNSYLSFNTSHLSSIFNNKLILSFTDLYDLVSSQIGEEETEAYIEGLELLNEYFIILSISLSLIDKEEREKIYKLKNKVTDEALWSIDAFKYIIDFNSTTKFDNNDDNIPLKLKYKFDLANLIVLFASMFSLLHNKKLLIMGNLNISFKTLFNQIDVDNDGLLSVNDIAHLFKKHKVNFSKSDIELIFLLNKIPEKTSMDYNVNNKTTKINNNYFDYKTFKGFIYLFSFNSKINKSGSITRFSVSRDFSRSKSPIDHLSKAHSKQQSTTNIQVLTNNQINNKFTKSNYSSIRLSEHILSLSKLEEGLEKEKEAYIQSGELSLIHLFQCFDTSNNDIITSDEFIASLEFLGITDTKPGNKLFQTYSQENSLSYLNFVEMLLPINSQSSMKLSRKQTQGQFKKLNFYQADRYLSTKYIIKNIFGYHISLQRHYLQIREQILLDKNFNLEEAFTEILAFNKKEINIKNKEILIEANDLFQLMKNIIYDSNEVDHSYISCVLSKISKRKIDQITIKDYKDYFELD